MAKTRKKEEPITPEPLPRFSSDEHGRLIANDGTHTYEVRVDGVTYEHVCNTADGRWVYQKL